MRKALEQSVGSYLEGAKCQYGVLEVRQMPEEYLIAGRGDLFAHLSQPFEVL